jgi:uncharacterized phage protein (TIGR01671 family)
MREIKFRAWDNTGEAWLNDKISIALSGTKLYEGKPIHTMLGKLAGNIFYMQYTGLYDIDGVEMCEGDIVKDKGNKISDVKFMNGCFCVKYEENEVKSLFDYMFDNDFLEVVGNIYENPEMLKKGG